MSLKLILLLSLLSISLSAPASAWRGKTIYQLLTDRFALTNGSTAPCPNLNLYCGGSFQGVINNLPYIQGMGFDAIWISPVPVNFPEGYHGYWATQWYEINPHFGTSQDLINLVDAAHAVGMWVMLDVVANHVGPVAFAYGQIDPFNQTTNYHSFCNINDWNNQTQVEFCRLAGLPDLAQEDNTTATLLLNWVSSMVSTYNFDGLRVDTVPEVPAWFWNQYTPAAGVFTIGEVFNGDVNYGAGYQGPLNGILNYPMFYTIRSVFQSGQTMNNIQSYYQAASAWPDQTLLGTFVDNHDNPRFLYQNGNVIMFKAALAFSLGAIGIPIVYYGDEQCFSGGNDPACREALWTSGYNTSAPVYQYLKEIIAFRKQTEFWQEEQIQRWSDDTFYAFTRGPYFFAFTNGEATQARNITYHPYPNGEYLCNIFWVGDCVEVQNGQFLSELLDGEVKIYYPNGTNPYSYQAY